MKNLIIRAHKAALLTCFVAFCESSRSTAEGLQPEGVSIREKVGRVSGRRDGPAPEVPGGGGGSRSANNAAVDDMA